MHKVLLISIYYLILCNSAIGQKVIEIKLDKPIDSKDQVILENISDREVSNLTLKLVNLDPNDDESKFTFSLINFTEESKLIELTKEKKGNALEFSLEPLKRISLPASGFYEYKITYSGTKAYPAIPTATPIQKQLKVVAAKQITDKTYDDLQIQAAATEYVKTKHNPKKFYSSKSGIYFEDNTVHIFVDQNGNLIYTGIPTTAKESYLYQLHLLVAKGTTGSSKFKFSYEGSYVPKFNILKTSEDIPKLNAEEDDEQESPIIQEIEFAKIGPFTDNFTIKLEKSDTDNLGKSSTQFLINSNVSVATLYHVSISTGLLASFVRNPQNIEKALMADGTTYTLIADDPDSRGIVTIMATYYPQGRSFLFPPSGGIFDPTRFGIQVGAQLNDKIQENFFLGLSHDFARGASFSYGAHFGRRSYVAGKRKFNFGKDTFDLPTLNIKKQWALGVYIGVVIDTRVALELFKSLGAQN